MLIREAAMLVQSAKFSESRKVALVCSFEPLHLKLYLQAFLVERFADETPEVLTFGYDQLRAGISATASSLKTSPALLCLSWEDMHPALSWRTRGLEGLNEQDLMASARGLQTLLVQWVESRRGAETYIVPPSPEFLPYLDACTPNAMGRTAIASQSILWDLLNDLSRRGGRVLRMPPFDLNYRGLLLSGCPLTSEDSELIVRRFVHAAFRSVPRKKVLAVDLDGTLWRGIIGEDGPEGILCRPEDHGHVFHTFQQFLLKLKREGVLLAFCSKNNPDDVVPLFDKLEMPLKLADFSAYRCNWEPKSTNLRAIASELNVGCDAMVALDDDQAELAEIKKAIPEICTYQTPREGREWQKLFSSLQDLFATWSVSEEDKLRADSLAQNRVRASRDMIAGNPYESDGLSHGLTHLRDLDLEVLIQRDTFHDPRSLELINKTNQFNLTGERFAQDEWVALAAVPGSFCWSARLKDRFGDFGTICVVTGHVVEGTMVYVRQFVLSCRAFGRGVETIMLGELLGHYGQAWLEGPFKTTRKNEPARKYLAAWGCDLQENGVWRLDRAAALKAYRETIEQSNAKARTICAAPVPQS